MNLACDVLVVGAGVAGVAAAVASARSGADTLLVEKRSFPGGAGVVGLHRHICGLYANGHEAAPDGALLNGGFVKEVCDGLRRLAPERRPIRIGKVDVLPYAPAHLQAVLNDLLTAELSFRVLWETEVRSAMMDGDRVSMVRVVSQVGEAVDVIPNVVVDASGDGVVIQTSRLLHEPPPANRQLAGYVIRLTGVASGDDLLPIKVPYVVRKGVDAGRLLASLRFMTYADGEDPGEGWCKLSFPAGTCVGEARKRSQCLVGYLRDVLPAFRDVKSAGNSLEVLEREGARLKGLYVLTEGDVRAGRSFSDVVARGAWPMEIWNPLRGPSYRYLDDGVAFYDIPSRCLKAEAVRNLYGAGRCISATPAALGSTRVMGICMALGEAAGNEAARQSKIG